MKTNERDVICDLITPGDVFIDIGANGGLFTRLVNQKCKGDVEIHSIEPHPIQYKTLEQNNTNNSNVTCYNAAVTNCDGIVELWYEPNDRVNHYGASTIMKELAVPRRLSDRLKSIKVNAITLDSLQLKPNLIKIDAEGAESDIIRGAEQTIKEHKPIIVFEYGISGPEDFHPESVNILKEYGYSYFWNIEDHRVFDNDTDFCNILAKYEN